MEYGRASSEYKRDIFRISILRLAMKLKHAKNFYGPTLLDRVPNINNSNSTTNYIATVNNNNNKSKGYIVGIMNNFWVGMFTKYNDFIQVPS